MHGRYAHSLFEKSIRNWGLSQSAALRWVNHPRYKESLSDTNAVLISIAEVKKFILFADADDRSTNIISLDVRYFVAQTLFNHVGNQRPIALDYDPVEDRVYWSDVAQGLIVSAFTNATSLKILFRCNILSPEGLVIDHVARNIYWTDTGTNRIEVARLDGSGRKELINTGLDEPRGILLDERNGQVTIFFIAMFLYPLVNAL